MTAHGSAVETDATPDERRWRRRCLWALLLLVPLALAEQSYESVVTLLNNSDRLARDVAWGQAAEFGGSEWRLANLRAASGVPGLPPNAVPVLADFTVRVGDADLQGHWKVCMVMLIDAAGRRWLPSGAVSLKQPDDVQRCNSAMFSGAKNGDTLKISETFLVPKDATATIRPAVSLAGERPRYLRFQRPQG
ncbi:MAG: hypothetical protein J0I98_20745 [Mesorhizobium sp.]|nr:hypothetical protein [Mesorhizobium sp.]MBN9245212.1 hypothetical protein [Mesorhizobium sp.]